MAIRWYSTVIDCRDVAAQSAWWARALDWRTVYEDEDEDEDEEILFPLMR